MSRIAKMPVKIPQGVSVDAAGDEVLVKGPAGELRQRVVREQVEVLVQDGEARVSPVGTSRAARALAGTTRSLIGGMVTGVTTGFEKSLELQGVGYRAAKQGKQLVMQLGFSHPVEYNPPDGIDIETPSQTSIVVRGADKQRVGQVAAELRAYRPPEPYKGKGVRYVGEQVRRKEGKKK